MDLNLVLRTNQKLNEFIKLRRLVKLEKSAMLYTYRFSCHCGKCYIG